MKGNKMIYLDNAATTRIENNVLGSMLPYMTDRFFNASSLYSSYNKEILEAKSRIALEINAEPDEIYFTSGGSESNALVLSNFDYVLHSEIEHSSIMSYKNDFYQNAKIKVDSMGRINVNDYLSKLDSYRRMTCFANVLVSIMFVNNEIGTVQNIKELAHLAHENGMLFHTDAVQAFGHIIIDVKEMEIDFMSVSGHKFGAPKGIGFIYISNKHKDKIKPIIAGTQNDGLRGGTYDLASIVGLKTAINVAKREYLFRRYLDSLKNKIIAGITDNISGIHINTPYYNYDCNNIISVIIRDVDANSLVSLLADRDIYISAGSACHSGSNEPSYVLKAIGLSDEEARSTIRISINSFNTEEEIDTFIKELTECVNILREV